MRYRKQSIPSLVEGDAVSYLDLASMARSNVIIDKAGESFVSFYDMKRKEPHYRSLDDYGETFLMGTAQCQIESPYRSISYDEACFYADFYNIPVEKKVSFIEMLADALCSSKCSIIDDRFVKETAEHVLENF